MSRKIQVEALHEIAKAARSAQTITDRSALYAAARVLTDELRSYVDLRMGSNPYAHEKLSRMRWHLGAMLGFDETNGHSVTDHYVWFLGDADSFKSTPSPDD